jgi:hypothetical protein
MTENTLMDAIRKADAFTNAAAVLESAAADRGDPDDYPEFWADIREHVIPTLEAKAEEASKEAARLRS